MVIGVKKDVFVLNEYGFMEKFYKEYKRDKIVLGSMSIGGDGTLTFLYLPTMDSDSCMVYISADSLLKATGYHDYEVVFNSNTGKYEVMLWKNI